MAWVKLEHVHLHGMHALLAIGHVLPGFADFFLLVVELLVEHQQLFPHRFGLLLISQRDAFAQRLDFPLAFEQAVLALIRREEGDAGAGQQIATRRHQSAPDARSVRRTKASSSESAVNTESSQSASTERNCRVIAAHMVAQAPGTLAAEHFSRA
jgi:hypothetical protein